MTSTAQQRDEELLHRTAHTAESKRTHTQEKEKRSFEVNVLRAGA